MRIVSIFAAVGGWSNALLPNQAFVRVERVFLRLLGLVYLIAFASLWPQMAGLVGSHGVSPVADVLATMRTDFGWRAYLYVPSLFWFHAADQTFRTIGVAGCICALLLLGGLCVRLAALACYILYLSLISVGAPFTSFQWDALLLEAGFLAIFAGSPLLPLAYRFLLFRLMFESGLVKLTSHDVNWRNLHALRYHFWTQPLPNPVAYFMNQAPHWLLDSLTAAVLLIELLVPFLLFVRARRLRATAVALLIALQVAIAVTGNFAFFNLLTIALCVWGLDDEFFKRLMVRAVRPIAEFGVRCANVCVALMLMLGLWQICRQFQPVDILPGFPATLESLQIVNPYGLFAVMTTTRNEIVIEGSNDSLDWKEYSFKWKPGDPNRPPPVIAPFQPRLDWMFWFAALGRPENNGWVQTFLYRLLDGQTEVLSLLDPPPFATPPRFIRAEFYRYEFTSGAERAEKGGRMWKRKLLGSWLKPVSRD